MISLDAAGDAAVKLQNRQRALLVAGMYLLMIGSGVASVFRPEHLVTRLLLPAAMCAIVARWCVVDARMRGSPIVQSLHWIIFFTWPLAAPTYLIRSRKLRGLGLCFFHAIGLYGSCLLAYHLTGYLVYGDAWLRAFTG